MHAERESREGPRRAARLRAGARDDRRDSGRGPRARSRAAGRTGRADSRGETDVVYGSRFLGGRPAAPGVTIAANRALTWLTNVLYGSSLTDMETCYKIMRQRRRARARSVGRSLRHRAGDHRQAARRGPPDPRAAGDVLAAIASRRQEDRLARRPARDSRAGPMPAIEDALVAMTRRRIAGALALIAVAAIAWAAAIWIVGGSAIVVGGLRITSSNVWRPLAVALVAAALAAGLAGATGPAGVRCDDRPTAHAGGVRPRAHPGDGRGQSGREFVDGERAGFVRLRQPGGDVAGRATRNTRAACGRCALAERDRHLLAVRLSSRAERTAGARARHGTRPPDSRWPHCSPSAGTRRRF